MKKVKVGIIGCGAIGSALAKILARRFSREAAVRYLCEVDTPKALRLKRELRGKPAIVPMNVLIRKADLVIEAASARISSAVAMKALTANKNVLIISVGGLLDNQAWQRIILRRRGQLWIPSGAVAGVDGLLATRESGIKRVTLITSKPPIGLQGAPIFKKKKFPVLVGQRRYCVFKGSARQAVKAFPQNVNVAAILSLAGIGPDKTRVEVWTSRAYKRNKHEIFIEGGSGTIRVEITNVPSIFNPKTSALAIFSAAAVCRKIFSSLRLGT
ncbi:MAG: DUF108 domain-containing protein [Candidatus Omnitrophica bacterium]|nr:DUF108 domain-containing protein [Candidatus Omnitrophota bacterium]MDD5671576.1 DUF108 domain-containing protein [Candidatus Omnitrophota bacterium]